jgi:DNA topoisomerase VI subunit A
LANNPTIAAIAFLERAFGVHRKDIAVLSLGCGTVVGPISVTENAGVWSWARPLISKASSAALHI